MGAPDATQFCLLASAHALERNKPAFLALLRARLTASDWRDVRRLREVVRLRRTLWRDAITRVSSHVAQLHAERLWSQSAWLRDQCEGLPLVRRYAQAVATVDRRPDELIAAFESIRAYCAQAAPVVISVAGSAAACARTRELLQAFASAAPANVTLSPWMRPDTPAHIGGSRAIRVAANAAATRLAGIAPEDAPAMLFMGTAVEHSYSWDEVRVRGNADGVCAHFAAHNGMFTLDCSEAPRLARTYAVLQPVPDYIAGQLDLSPHGIEHAIIGAVKYLDRPLRGGQSVSEALLRHIIAETPAHRAAFCARLPALTRAEMLRVNEEFVRPALAQATWCTLASDAMRRAAAAELSVPLSITTPSAAIGTAGVARPPRASKARCFFAITAGGGTIGLACRLQTTYWADCGFSGLQIRRQEERGGGCAAACDPRLCRGFAAHACFAATAGLLTRREPRRHMGGRRGSYASAHESGSCAAAVQLSRRIWERRGAWQAGAKLVC